MLISAKSHSSLPSACALLCVLNFTCGPSVQLQYDSAPVHIGSLESSVWVFGLLGSFYAVLGSLYVLSDSLIASGALGEGEHCLNGCRCRLCT